MVAFRARSAVMTTDPKAAPETVRSEVARRLPAALTRADWSLPEGAAERIAAYLAELVRWNRAYNLTAVTDPAEMVERHVMDSLSVRPFLSGRRILDAGTGAGLPGVVLAIAEPERHFLLVDSSLKKVRFLKHVKRALELDNIEPLHARLESLTLEPPPDEILARALAPLPRLVEWLAPWIDAGAPLLAMKGQLDRAEMDAVPDRFRVRRLGIEWPGMEAARCVAVIEAGSPGDA